MIIEKIDDLIELVEVVDLHLAFFVLSEGGESTCGSGSHIGDLVSEHVAKRWN